MSYSDVGKFSLNMTFKFPNDRERVIELVPDRPIMICGLPYRDVKNLHPGSPYCLDSDATTMDSKHDTLSWDMEHYWMTTRSKKSAKKKWGDKYIYIEGVYLDF